MGSEAKMKKKLSIIRLFLPIQFVFLSSWGAQKPDSLEVEDHFSGTVGLTSSGISLVPTFSLGDPAILFDLKYFHRRFRIQPDIRFSLEAKPWSFLFWLPY